MHYKEEDESRNSPCDQNEQQQHKLFLEALKTDVLLIISKLVTLQNTLDRSLLYYIDILERVQRRATKMKNKSKNISYEMHLKECG